MQGKLRIRGIGISTIKIPIVDDTRMGSAANVQRKLTLRIEVEFDTNRSKWNCAFQSQQNEMRSAGVLRPSRPTTQAVGGPQECSDPEPPRYPPRPMPLEPKHSR
jgi:hypothetical protein